MEDFFGRELNIGDTVACLIKNYRGLVKAKIIDFTTHYVRVEYLNTWNFSNGRKENYLCPSNWLVKEIK